jgi:fibronectin type 3 domain-containing protein
MKSFRLLIIILIFIALVRTSLTNAQTFVHPGGLHTLADLDRMKARVAEGAHPWIDGWNVLINDAQAQNTYNASPNANMGASRQRADADAHAAYLNALRWYITGDVSYAECAVRICNAWSAAVNVVPSGGDIPGLSGIPVFDFAMAAEILRIYPGWATADFDRFKNMMVTYWYPVCHNFLANHNNACITHYWANWDICNAGALIAIGVLCDNVDIYNEGVEYFKNGGGAGSITNAVFYRHPGNLGQWQESGRDQEHAQLGVGMMGYLCQIAWNQGLDLFGYDNNRLLSGAEYVARTNLMQPVPYSPYNNCDNVNQFWLSINGIGRLDDRPVWELIYNHYVVRKGLSAPNIQAMAQVTRPEHGSLDHFGYGTLTFTLDASASPYPPSPTPDMPLGLEATAGTSRVTLKWDAPIISNVQGYTIMRSTTRGGPYTTLSTSTNNVYNQYTDATVTNGITYYYIIAANNQSGTSAYSSEVSSTPVAAGPSLLKGWTYKDIGNYVNAGSVRYANVGDNTFIVSGSGTDIGGTSDGFGFAYGIVSGDITFTARILSIGGTLKKTGIMIRESLNTDCKAILMKLGDAGWRQSGCGIRSTTGGTMSWTAGNDYTWTPAAWFKIQRAGNTFTASSSGDGITWFTVATGTIDMSNKYYIGLVACSGNTGAFDNTTFDNVIVTTGISAPSAPLGLEGTASNSKKVQLKWRTTTLATTYSVKRAATEGGPYTVLVSGVSDTTYLDSGLTPMTSYYYVVTASNFAGESNNSSEVVISTPMPPLPQAPLHLRANSGNGRVSLSWDPVDEADSYNVKRSETAGGPYTLLMNTNITDYIDKRVTNGVTYYYIVAAANLVGEGALSDEVNAIPNDTTGGIAYWPFNETVGTTANDIWGDLSATLGSGVILTSGAINNGVKLDGTSNGVVTLPNGIVSTLTDFTISSWVKINTLSTWARIFDFGTGTTNYMFLSPSSGTTVRYSIRTSSVAEKAINGTSVLPTGVWAHVAVTQAGSTAILYVNGAEVGRNMTMTLNPSSLGSTTLNRIGISQFASDTKLNGTVDEFRIYNKALSAADVKALFDELAPGKPGNLSVAPTTNEVKLTWDAASGATSYSIKRATVSGGPYTTVASDIEGTTYMDAATSAGGPYYYVVTSRNGSFESVPSNEVSILLTPAVPSGGTALGWSGRIDLSWIPSNGATSYNVKRSTTSGGPYVTVANATGKFYSNIGMDNGTQYYYVLSAVNATGESANSVEFSSVPVNNPSLDVWLHTDVGSTGVQGNAGFNADMFTVYGSGADIWTKADAFQFVYQPFNLSDGAIVARVVTQDNTAAAAKAGVMIRESLMQVDSRVALVDRTPNNVVEYIRRTAANTNAVATTASGMTAPRWVKLVRSSTTNFTAYQSADGINWTMVGSSQNIAMGTNAYIGLAVCANKNTVLNKATFDHINIATSMPVISSLPTVTAIVGVPFAYTIVATNTPYLYTASGLPEGLSFNADNGEISGTPNIAGSFSITLGAINAMGAAAPITFTLDISKGNQTIDFDAIPAKIFGDGDFDAAAIASSGLAVVYSTSDTTVATIVNGMVHIVGAGTCTIYAYQPGDINYKAAEFKSQLLTVNKADQTIAFATLPTVQIGDAGFSPEATASSGLPVIYTSSNILVAFVYNGKIYPLLTGASTITASQAGNKNYNAAVSVKQLLTVTKRAQKITFPAFTTMKVGGPNFSPGATASSGYPVTYTSSNTKVAIIVGNKIRLVGTGTSTITAYQPGSFIYSAATPVSRDLVVVKKKYGTTMDEVVLDQLTLKVFPNPVKDVLNLEVNNSVSNAPTVYLYNETGLMVISGKLGNTKESFDVSRLPSGIYFLKLIDGDQIINLKIVKQ